MLNFYKVVATDLREGDSFNSSFLHRSFLNLTVIIMNTGPLAKFIMKIYVVYFYLRYGVHNVGILVSDGKQCSYIQREIRPNK